MLWPLIHTIPLPIDVISSAIGSIPEGASKYLWKPVIWVTSNYVTR